MNKYMTVKELVQKLMSFPMDSEILVTSWEQDRNGDIHYFPVTEVGESWLEDKYVPTIRFDDGMKEGYIPARNKE